jgi:hypothetical protein
VKSTLLINVAARVSTGSPWHDQNGHAPQGSVLILAVKNNKKTRSNLAFWPLVRTARGFISSRAYRYKRRARSAP